MSPPWSSAEEARPGPAVMKSDFSPPLLWVELSADLVALYSLQVWRKLPVKQ